MIRIITKKDGEVVLNNVAKAGVSLEDIQFIAEAEVNGGYADYARVEVDGKVYIELEG